MATKTTLARLSAFAPAGGQLTRMEDIADRDLRLIAAEETETQYGDGFRLTLIDDKADASYEVLTSAVVVVKQIRKMLESDPFQETIVNFTKSGRCWVIV